MIEKGYYYRSPIPYKQLFDLQTIRKGNEEQAHNAYRKIAIDSAKSKYRAVKQEVCGCCGGRFISNSEGKMVCPCWFNN